MPSKSKAQARLMAAVAHNADFAKKVGISRVVGREFFEADKQARATELVGKLRKRAFKNG